MSDNIKVVVKVRPLISREIDQKLSYQWRVKSNTLYQLDQNGKDLGPCFTFDKVYDKDTKTPEVYNDVAKPIVEAAIAGFNGTIFAYGQTSSGKTFTMTGTEDSPGIIPLAVLNLFDTIKNVPNRDFLVRVAYIEIYNETVRDLLNLEKKNIKVHDTFQGVKVDATERPTSSPEEVLEAMREGEANRQTGATNMNEESSRSHSIFQITIESREHIEGEEEEGCVNVSTLNLVDLAGSERSGQTGATGIRFKEGTHINKSLSVLALVIKQLSEDPNKHANYRDSKLTRILQNSLGGNAKTSIICAITPASVEETISTLQFANRAKFIKNKPEVNAVATDATKLHSLTKQLSQLQSELQIKKNIEQDNVNLQKQIAALQKLILNGFGQPTRVDIVTNNRKKFKQPSRRMTISTPQLHSIEEDATPSPPKFCTPSLKYNSWTISGPSEFLTINANQLPTLPEESNRAVTPPPPDKVNNIDDDIIELDSDDDITIETQKCSPYHKCYGASKTPPCILRQSAKEAEKKLKDIVELTEREKIYTPSVVELFEKLEENTNVILRLEEKVETLTKESNEKDSQLNQLKDKISKTEEEIKSISTAKTYLEAQCRKYNTELTDWEVSYETLVKKSKRREDELLLLLEEHNILKKSEESYAPNLPGKEISLIDISKEISLVDSNESQNSMNNDDESPSQIQVTGLKAQLAAKNQVISELETNIKTQNKKIEALHESSSELQAMIESFKSKLEDKENENAFLKSTIESLNSTVESQKTTIEFANTDIQSYNSLIQELQIKLNKKESLPYIKINDIMIENLIANEEKFIANNENMKNIIQTFRTALDAKNKEIDKLQSSVQGPSESSANNAALKRQVEIKETQINALIEEVEKLKDQLNENITVINKLMDIEQEATKKLYMFQEQNDSLQKRNEENKIQIEQLIENNKKLKVTIVEKEMEGQKISNKYEDLTKNIIDLTEKVSELEKSIVLKEDLIVSLKDRNKESRKHLPKTKPLISKLQNILIALNHKSIEIPESIDCMETFFIALSDNLSNLDIAATKIIEEKTESHENTKRLKNELSTLIKNHQIELDTFKSQIKNIAEERNTINCQNQDLLQQIIEMKEQLDKSITEMDAKNREISDIKTNLKDARETNEKLRNDILSKADMITSLEEKTRTLYLGNNVLQENVNRMEIELATLTKQHETALTTFEFENKNLMEERNVINRQKEDMSRQINVLDNKVDELKSEVEVKNRDIQILTAKLNEAKETIENLRYDLVSKEDVITSLQEKVNFFCSEKNLTNENAARVEEEISILTKQHETEIATLKLQITNLNEERNVFNHQITLLKEQLDKISNELDVKSSILIDFTMKLNDAKETNENLRNDILSKEEMITCLQKKLEAKEQEIVNVLDMGIKESESLLEEKRSEVLKLKKELDDAIQTRDKFLENISNKASKLILDLNIDYSELQNNDDNIVQHIIAALDKIADHIKLSQPQRTHVDIKEILIDANSQVTELAEQNDNLLDDFSELDRKHKELLDEADKIKIINQNLAGTSHLLVELKVELKAKAEEIQNMEHRARELKAQFMEFESIMKQQMKELRKENKNLKQSLSFSKTEEDKVENTASRKERQQETTLTKSLPQVIKNIERSSPLSLLTICCNTIIDTLQLSDTDSSVTTTSSKLSIVSRDAETQAGFCECAQLIVEIKAAKEENLKLANALKYLESANRHLINEQEAVRKEVRLILESSTELQKKISNHRTNLSTLAATTYAENKLLNSQLKVLKHHHTRYIHVCQREIPAFKVQLNELMTILNENTPITDKQNSGIKRYSLPDFLDSNTTSNFKNESTLDGDLLMLDTNVTMSTSESTIIGLDQTCLDVTQINFDNEVACQTNDLIKVTEPCYLCSQIDTLRNDNKEMCEKLEALKTENRKLWEQIEKCSVTSTSVTTSSDKIDDQSSHIKLKIDSSNESFSSTSSNCNCREKLQPIQDKLTEEVQMLLRQLAEVKTQKEYVEKQYSSLSLEIPSTDALIRKIDVLEKQYNCKVREIENITNDLHKKNKLLKELQKENDTMSTQFIENISETDDLKKELDAIKKINVKLTEKCKELEQITVTKSKMHGSFSCPQCPQKDEFINSLQSKQRNAPHSRLNRSLSDSDSSSRYNKICTLQHELHESKEDCKKITEEVSTIKNHLECSTLPDGQAMDLDESMGDGNMFTITKNFEYVEPQLNKIKLPNIPEDYPTDIYMLDKINCLNYYLEKTGTEKENLNHDLPIIEIMKLLHNDLVTKHTNEVENLVNRMRDFEDSRNQLQSQINNAKSEYYKITKELEEKENNLKNVANVVSHIKTGINVIHEEMSSNSDVNHNKLIKMFKDNLFEPVDTHFGLSSVDIFESFVNNTVIKNKNELSCVLERHTQLQDRLENVVAELNQLKHQLSNKETEYDTLKVQKEKIHEICNTVTLDIIKKEQDLKSTLEKGLEKLLQLNILSPDELDLTLPLNKNVNILFEHIIRHINERNSIDKDRESLILEASNKILKEKEKEIDILKVNLSEEKTKLEVHKYIHQDLNKNYENKVKENEANLVVIKNLTREINVLKENISEKESVIHNLESELKIQKQGILNENLLEFTKTIEKLQQENESLKTVNRVLLNEKETCALELEKAGETIKQNKIELEKMTSDILVLKEEIKENTTVIESMSLEAKSLVQQNLQLKEQFHSKCQDCSRLEVNIKTHEKTAEIQTKMIKRLQKQKEEDSEAIFEKDKKLEELTQQCMTLQKECEVIKENTNVLLEEIAELKKIKEILEARVTKLEAEVESGQKQRLSIDAIAATRRRRQSIQDLKRGSSEGDFEDYNKMEAVFDAREKPDDLFMDVDYDNGGSSRNSPMRLSRRRDSLLRDLGDKEDEHSSRPSSALANASRLRRQSVYDKHRSVLQDSTSLQDMVPTDHNLKPSDSSDSNISSEVVQLRERLATCQQELEDLREMYRELDEECETCAQYLRERDDQCSRLKKEKRALESQVKELQEKLTEPKFSFAHASVNTDEDWANLHAVVVDRMSFDAEVEKNKKLTKTIEELHYKKQELKTTLAKMQRAMEKRANANPVRELELTKTELRTCRGELEELKQRYRELDQYLRERDEQCRKLRETKTALEARLEEFQADSSLSSMVHSVRKKRQSMHDQNRSPATDLVDATTETSDDFLSYQVERDVSAQTVNDNSLVREVSILRLALDRVTKEKEALQRSATGPMNAAHPTLYVATGSAIVQNQQITDVMKENEKLKKMNAKLINICKKRGKLTDS